MVEKKKKKHFRDKRAIQYEREASGEDGKQPAPVRSLLEILLHHIC